MRETQIDDESWKKDSLWYRLYECYNELREFNEDPAMRMDAYVKRSLEEIEKRMMLLTDYLADAGCDFDIGYNYDDGIVYDIEIEEGRDD